MAERYVLVKTPDPPKRNRRKARRSSTSLDYGRSSANVWPTGASPTSLSPLASPIESGLCWST